MAIDLDTYFQAPPTPPPISSKIDLDDFFSFAKQAGKAALTAALPGWEQAYDAYQAVEPAAAPILRAPSTGIGGLIALGQGRGLDEAAAGIRAGKTAGQYVAEAIPDTQVMPGVNDLGRKGLGLVVDTGILTGATEGVTNPPEWLGAGKIDVSPKAAPPAPPELQRPADVEMQELSTGEVVPKSDVVGSVDLDKFFGFESPAEPLPAEPSPETLETPRPPEAGVLTSIPVHEELTPSFEMAAAESGNNTAQANLFQQAAQNIRDAANKFQGMDPVADAGTPKYLIAQRYGDIQVGRYNNELFVRDVTGKLSPEETQALPFVMEGTIPDKFPEGYVQNPQVVTQLFDHPTPAMQQALARIRPWYDQWHQALSQAYDDPNYVENYVTHLWDLDKSPAPLVKTYFQTKSRFLKGRIIQDYAGGIAKGMVPKFNNIGDIMRAYSNYNVEALANQKLADQMIASTGGVLAHFKNPNTPPNFVPVDQVRRQLSYRKGDTEIRTSAPLMMDPEFYQDFRTIFEAPLSHPAITAVQKLNSVERTIQLSLSAFHHLNLTTASLAAQGAKGTAVAVKNLFKYSLGVRGEFPVWKDPQISRRWLGAGLTLGGVQDTQPQEITKAIKAAADWLQKSPLTKLPGKGIEGANTLYDAYQKGLWNQFQPEVKLGTAEALYALSRDKFPKLPDEMVRRKIADYVNSVYGGQVWQLLFKDPKTTQFLHLSAYAADWTVSVARNFGAMFKGGVHPQMPKTYFSDDPAGFAARRTWFRAALGYFLMGNAMTYAVSRWFEGKGHFMWDNDPDHKWSWQVWGGKTSPRRYLKPAKWFTDPFDLFADPMQFAANRSAPFLRHFVEQTSGAKIGGYQTELAKGEKTLAKRARVALGHFKPASMQPGSAMGFGTLSKGASPYKIKMMVYDALKKNDIPELKKIQKVAANNAVNYAKAYHQAKNELAFERKQQKKADTPGFFKLRELLKQN